MRAEVAQLAERGPGGRGADPRGQAQQHPDVEPGRDRVRGGGPHAVVRGDPGHVDTGDVPVPEPALE